MIFNIYSLCEMMNKKLKLSISTKIKNSLVIYVQRMIEREVSELFITSNESSFENVDVSFFLSLKRRDL